MTVSSIDCVALAPPLSAYTVALYVPGASEDFGSIWIVASAFDYLDEELLRSQMISLDDTPTPTKDPSAPHGMMRGRMWLYLGDVSRVAYCEFSPDWKGSHPQRVLQAFRGPIQNDGYSGLHALFCARDAPPRVGCNDHARRKCVEALRAGDTRVERVLALYSALYSVERDAKGLDAGATLALAPTGGHEQDEDGHRRRDHAARVRARGAPRAPPRGAPDRVGRCRRRRLDRLSAPSSRALARANLDRR